MIRKNQAAFLARLYEKGPQVVYKQRWTWLWRKGAVQRHLGTCICGHREDEHDHLSGLTLRRDCEMPGCGCGNYIEHSNMVAITAAGAKMLLGHDKQVRRHELLHLGERVP